MTQMPGATRRVAVIGGGITGLAAAHRLLELDPTLDVAILEASDRLGGVIQTFHKDGFLIERSADNFITNVPWALDLCQRVGIAERLLETNASRRKAFVVHDGRLQHIPDGFLLMVPGRLWPIVKTPILTFRGKLRLAWEYFTPRRRDTADESLASFATRRLGREVYQRLVQPLIGGIYTADPEKLSIAATMPRLVEMERRHGGLIRGARRRRAPSAGDDAKSSGARYSMFVTPRGGLTSLIDAIAARLPQHTPRLNWPVEQLTRRADGRWRLTASGRDPKIFEAVIVALPAPRAARLLASVDRQLATLLENITYAGATVVAVGYRREQVSHALNGFGFVVPSIEGRRILAGSFSSIKYADRAPQGSVLFRVFVGGACQAELADLSDADLRRLVGEELAELLGVRGEPTMCQIVRWKGAMPQYHVGHVELVERVETRAAELPHLELAGNAYHGVGIPHCIHGGEEAARRIVQA